MPIKTQNYIHDYFNKNKGNYDRSEKFNYELKKGQQWFSITNYCVKYILSNKNLIREMFKYSACPDEHFIQTLIYNSKFKNNISISPYFNFEINSLEIPVIILMSILGYFS